MHTRMMSMGGELGVLLRVLREPSLTIAAHRLGVSRWTLRRWLDRLADDLDDAGFDGSPIRAMLRSRRRATVNFTDLSRADRQQAIVQHQLAPSDLAPAPCRARDEPRVKRAVGALWHARRSMAF